MDDTWECEATSELCQWNVGLSPVKIMVSCPFPIRAIVILVKLLSFLMSWMGPAKPRKKIIIAQCSIGMYGLNQSIFDEKISSVPSITVRYVFSVVASLKSTKSPYSLSNMYLENRNCRSHFRIAVSGVSSMFPFTSKKIVGIFSSSAWKFAFDYEKGSYLLYDGS